MPGTIPGAVNKTEKKRPHWTYILVKGDTINTIKKKKDISVLVNRCHGEKIKE